MTVLSDRTIRQLLSDNRLIVSPEPKDIQIQPVSIDMRLDHMGKKVYGGHTHVARLYQDIQFPYTLFPGECILASTVEHVKLPDNLVARVEGKSTWGRRFITVHHTAGLIDPGFKGQITLEIKNNGPAAVELCPDDLICQLTFEWTDIPVERPYGHPSLNSHYQGQVGATPPRSIA